MGRTLQAPKAATPCLRCKAPDVAYARFFNLTVELWEDAATGTAAGPLAAYLGASVTLKSDMSYLFDLAIDLL